MDLWFCLWISSPAVWLPNIIWCSLVSSESALYPGKEQVTRVTNVATENSLVVQVAYLANLYLIVSPKIPWFHATIFQYKKSTPYWRKVIIKANSPFSFHSVMNSPFFIVPLSSIKFPIYIWYQQIGDEASLNVANSMGYPWGHKLSGYSGSEIRTYLGIFVKNLIAECMFLF